MSDISVERLLKLLENKAGVILVSGDIHMAEILKYTCSKYLIY